MALQSPPTRGELSLVHESNRAVRHVIEACGGTPIKTFRVYEKQLDRRLGPRQLAGAS